MGELWSQLDLLLCHFPVLWLRADGLLIFHKVQINSICLIKLFSITKRTVHLVGLSHTVSGQEDSKLCDTVVLEKILKVLVGGRGTPARVYVNKPI